MIERSKTMARETARDRWNSKAWVRWSVGISTPIIIGLAMWLFGLSTRVTAIELDTAVIVERQSGHKEQLDRMERKLDKLIDRELTGGI